MHQRTLAKLVQSDAPPMTWALLCLPSRQRLKRWKTIESVFNGGFFERDDGLLVRIRGVELGEPEVRWMHAIVGRRSTSLSLRDIRIARHTFFPDTALVLQALVPHEHMGDDEWQGLIEHLWWAVDGNAGLPPVQDWEMTPYLDSSSESLVHD